jgi:hypothetical protein
MEILAGKSSCYNLLAFISLKMESYWANNPIGLFTSNLPCLKRFYEFNLHKIVDSTKTEVNLTKEQSIRQVTKESKEYVN